MRNYKPYRYVPGKEPSLDAQFAGAVSCAKVKLAPSGLFWKAGFHWHYIPLAGMLRIYRRREGRYGRLCAGGRNYIIEWLVLDLPEGGELVLHIGDDTEREAIALMEALAKTHPEIPYGKV